MQPKGASSIVDLGMEVSIANQGNDKAREALGTLEKLQSRDNSKIVRLWVEGDGHIGANLPLLMYLSKQQVELGQSVDRESANSG